MKGNSIESERALTIRAITHEFLLQIGDSTSRILPVEKVDERYAVKIEGEFQYQPGQLQFSTQKILENQEINERYLVEVEECDKDEVVHTFEVHLLKQDNLNPCSSREFPVSCYVFYFTIGEPDIVIMEDKKKSNYVPYYVAGGGLIVMILFLVFRKKEEEVEDPNIIKIGDFQFDQKGMKLISNEEDVELSSKEADLLSLLFKNENKTLERDYILKVVWGDDGDYVGRTLDVFISKLRKKLEADPTIKIVNIRGVGYRFVIH